MEFLKKLIFSLLKLIAVVVFIGFWAFLYAHWQIREDKPYLSRLKDASKQVAIASSCPITSTSGQPFTIELVINNPTFERFALPLIQLSANLEQNPIQFILADPRPSSVLPMAARSGNERDSFAVYYRESLNYVEVPAHGSQKVTFAFQPVRAGIYTATLGAILGAPRNSIHLWTTWAAPQLPLTETCEITVTS